MQRRSAILVVFFAAASVECAELHADEEFVCFVPPNCACGEDPYFDGCDPSCEGGEFPADAQFRVVALIQDNVCSPAEVEDFECHVSQTGSFELTIESSWRAASSPQPCGEDAIICEGVEFDCGETPVLAAGEWTIKYGASTEVFVVPSPETTGPLESWNCFVGE